MRLPEPLCQVSFLRADSDDFVLKARRSAEEPPMFFPARSVSLQVPPRPQLPVLLPADLFYPFTIGHALRALRLLRPALAFKAEAQLPDWGGAQRWH